MDHMVQSAPVDDASLITKQNKKKTRPCKTASSFPACGNKSRFCKRILLLQKLNLRGRKKKQVCRLDVFANESQWKEFSLKTE